MCGHIDSDNNATVRLSQYNVQVVGLRGTYFCTGVAMCAKCVNLQSKMTEQVALEMEDNIIGSGAAPWIPTRPAKVYYIGVPTTSINM